MIDREGEGAGFFRRSRTSGAGEAYQEQSGLSNKAMVYLVIMALIVILCIVYVYQLRGARSGGKSQDTAAVIAETAAEPSAEVPAETPAEGGAEAPAEGAAEAPAETPAETPAEEAAEAPAEEAAQTPAE